MDFLRFESVIVVALLALYGVDAIRPPGHAALVEFVATRSPRTRSRGTARCARGAHVRRKLFA